MTRFSAFAGALLCLLFALSAEAKPRAAGFSPECHPVFMPCIGASHNTVAQVRVSRREARRIARANRFRNVEFGSPMYPPETAKRFLGRQSGLVAPLASKLASIQAACPGTVAVSGVRHTKIAGTNRWSLHVQGKAVDVQGPYRCIYVQLRGWPGGYSTDAARMRHIHISYDAEGGREMGLAFRHGRHRKFARHQRGHRVAHRPAVQRPHHATAHSR